MPFIGNKPSAVPLTSADIADSIITSAKITDGTITNTDVASSIITGQTAETSIAGGDSVLIYDDSASALRKMTRTNFVAGVGGANTPAFFAYANTNQTATDDASQKITFGTESFDTDGAFASSRFTVPSGKAGKYYIFGSVRTIAATNSTLENNDTIIYINGSAKFKNENDFSTNQIREFTTNVSAIFDLIVGDYVEIYHYYHSSVSVNGTYGSGDTSGTYFGGYKIIE